jgi:hypothetical protein
MADLLEQCHPGERHFSAIEIRASHRDRCGMSVSAPNVGFGPDRELVVRGVLDKWENEDQRTNEPGMLLASALQRIFKEDWNILVYNSFIERHGDGIIFHYRNKWWIYGVRTSSTTRDRRAIEQFCEEEFGWGNVADAPKLRSAIERRVNDHFDGTWRVHLLKLANGTLYYSNIFGGSWNHDGYKVQVMRMS